LFQGYTRNETCQRVTCSNYWIEGGADSQRSS
jgi:hypothetical protein